MSDSLRPIVWKRQLISTRSDWSLIATALSSTNISDTYGKYSDFIQNNCFPDLYIFQKKKTLHSILKIGCAFDYIKSKDTLLEKVSTERLLHLICILYYVFENESQSLASILTIVKKRPIWSFLSTNPDMPLTEEQEWLQRQPNVAREYFQSLNSQLIPSLISNQPDLSKMLFQLNISPLHLLSLTMPTIFSNQLRLEIVIRLIDIWSFEGEGFILRVWLALLEKVKWKMKCNKKATVVNIFTSNQWSGYLEVGSSQEFLKLVRDVLRRKKNV
ncbi:hypothetical protein DAMA08_012420 [Martiniozyma asiatica (nom. inval.)]|nr:hypothetical protein DAMA08_012420 [Martiniozyma asiatica]